MLKWIEPLLNAYSNAKRMRAVEDIIWHRASEETLTKHETLLIDQPVLYRLAQFVLQSHNAPRIPRSAGGLHKRIAECREMAHHVLSHAPDLFHQDHGLIGRFESMDEFLCELLEAFQNKYEVSLDSFLLKGATGDGYGGVLIYDRIRKECNLAPGRDRHPLEAEKINFGDRPYVNPWRLARESYPSADKELKVGGATNGIAAPNAHRIGMTQYPSA